MCLKMAKNYQILMTEHEGNSRSIVENRHTKKEEEISSYLQKKLT